MYSKATLYNAHLKPYLTCPTNCRKQWLTLFDDLYSNGTFIDSGLTPPDRLSPGHADDKLRCNFVLENDLLESRYVPVNIYPGWKKARGAAIYIF